ncbi:bifunctional 2-polyprenyl-6-hydroxyphenol methylase/3-demethylubiquinol 3-O-methyltransferase UbiG [Methylobacterium sp. NEAU K]|uniref:class I SAM-dependent methyltransferase n=1 Tax=Methylobacterium sp. NEAU K TaxID=3064946 RepID=UPI0027328921|nr:class I SAM-dependent methyltransferase [Methylobacterium sp. NEAU K]MDP4004804.1 class I SAM-dependent methyltransferase [Methylobacterium sp. NEAU K]
MDIQAPSISKKSFLQKIANIILIPLQDAQGMHADPEEQAVPDPAAWTKSQREAWQSVEMELFRDAIRIGTLRIRESVLNDLSAYYQISSEECREKCLHWEKWSVEEWKSADRTTNLGIRDFYNTTKSWSFDLMWYAYLQATGHSFPAAVMTSRFVLEHSSGRRHLDFGSGVGVTSQLFRRLGFETSLADVSCPLLDFARWRLERRGDTARYIDLNNETLPENTYDCITALDTLVHVTDFDDTIDQLHRALHAGGWLFANFDIRARDSEASASHLYHDAIDLDCRLQKRGFINITTLNSVTHCYQRIVPGTIRHKLHNGKNFISAPMRRSIFTLQRVRFPTPVRVIKLAYRLATGRKIVTNEKFLRS